jgi:hypothetical protein
MRAEHGLRRANKSPATAAVPELAGSFSIACFVTEDE